MSSIQRRYSAPDLREAETVGLGFVPAGSSVASDRTETAQAPNLSQELYRSLHLSTQTKSIRVLDLQPSLSESRDDPIRGRLRVVHLTEDPGFVALSYVWGRPSRSPRAVYCNDIPISVTKNCWDALWHLRDPILGRGRARNTDGSITLWIDSICINQSDKTEKDSQIPLMNDIYSGARSVCVWLGTGTPETDSVIEYLKGAGWQRLLEQNDDSEDSLYRMPGFLAAFWAALDCKVMKPIMTPGQLSPFILRRVFRPPGSAMCFPDGLNISTDAVAQFLTKKWTQRIWTFQEAVLARDLWFCCGTRQIDWRSLVYATTYLEWANRNFEIDRFPGDACDRWRGLIALWLFVHRPRHQASPLGDAMNSGVVILGDAMDDYLAFLRHVRSLIRGFTYFNMILGIFCYLFAGVVWYIRGPSDSGRVAASVIMAIVGTFIVFAAWVYRGQPLLRDSPRRDARHDLDMSSIIAREIHSRRATMAEDKSYGVHAVVGCLGMQLSPPSASLAYGDLCRELFVQLLGSSQNPNILLCVSQPPAGQPSWVPDWSMDRRSLWIKMEDFPRRVSTRQWPALFQIGSQRRTRARQLSRSVDTWGNCTPLKKEFPEAIFALRNGDRELVLRGFHLHQVSWCGGPFLGGGATEAQRSVQVHDWEIFAKAIWEGYGRYRQSSMHYLFEGRIYQRKTGLANGNIQYYHEQVKAWVDFIDKYAQLEPNHALDLLMEPENQAIRSLHNWVARKLANTQRSLFISDVTRTERPFFVNDPRYHFKSGGVFGNCPAHTQAGDRIILSAGVSAPLVLRPLGEPNKYRLVGFAIFYEPARYGNEFEQSAFEIPRKTIHKGDYFAACMDEYKSGSKALEEFILC